MKNSLLATLVATVGFCGSQTIQAANFEDVAVAPGANTVTLGDLNSGGFLFDTSENEFHLINGDPSYAYSGSTMLLVHSLGGNNVLTMSPIGGGTFDLISSLLAEGYTTASGNASENATSVLITGHLFGGGTISTTFTLDGINDGPGGGLPDFQLATFSPAWVNLTSVDFDGVGGNDGRMAIDNIVVPEPSSLALVGIGAFALAWRKLARKK